MKTLNFILLFALLTNVYSQNNPISSKFKLKWQAKTGLTTYRSNMIYSDNLLFIGSNGESRSSVLDDLDGVHILDPKTGKTKAHIKPIVLGDNDVNGVVVSDGKVYFGNDNNYFFCYDFAGNEIWQSEIENDAESCPVLSKINADEVFDVVFTVEGKGLVALDGSNGNQIWRFYTDHYRGYNGSPCAMDITGDGIDDFFIGGEGTPSEIKTAGWKMAFYGDYFYAISGVNGSVLWAYEVGSKIHASPLIIQTERDTSILFSPCYGDVFFSDPRGKVFKIQGCSIGTFASPVATANNGHIVIGTSWFGDSDQMFFLPMDTSFFEVHKSGTLVFSDKVNENPAIFATGRSSASVVVADVTGEGKQEVLHVSEKGKLLVCSVVGKKIYELDLPAGAEATPIVADIDADGMLEILIACLDGNLYCYATKSKGKITWGQFRGNNRNSGVFKDFEKK